MKKTQTNRGLISFLILTFVGIIVALFAMGFFTEQRPFGFDNYRKILKLDCGLNLYTPTENTEIVFPYKISGYANGCDWEPVNGVVGTATILAGNGLVLAKVNLVTNTPLGDAPYYFETTVDVMASFLGEQGMVVIENMLPGLQRNVVRVPVLFNSRL